jgi:hypothetical protein
VLTVQGTGLLGYQNAMPITTRGDLITGDSGGAAVRLARGTTDQLISVNATGDLLWKTLTTMTNPMSAVGDVIVGAASGVPARLAIGSTNQVLTVVAGTPAWTTPFANPMTTAQDLIVGGASGVATRLAKGTDTQVLTVVAGAVAWAAAPAGLSNPMTNIGDLITGGTSGSPTRLAAVATGAVLASAGLNTAPVWSVSPALTNVKLGGGIIGTSGVGVLALGPSTAPTTSPVDTVQLYTADMDAEAGSRSLYVRDERGGICQFATVLGAGEITLVRASSRDGIVTDLWAHLSDQSGAVGTTSQHPFNINVGGQAAISFATNRDIYVWFGGLAAFRLIQYGNVDSAGSGYRSLRILN